MIDTYWSNGICDLYQCDARHTPLPNRSVHCVVTSPPYYGLRVYRSDSAAMIGLEKSVQGWLDSMMEVMAEVWRVLRDDGVCWVNLGDSYGGSKNSGGTGKRVEGGTPSMLEGLPDNIGEVGQLLGIPWRFALAMQDAGWILRSDVIWAKKSPMPESLAGTRWERCRVKVEQSQRGKESWPQGSSMGTPQGDHVNGHIDGSAQWSDCPGCARCQDHGGYVLRNGSWRCTSAHEHIFQFVKQMGYYSDGEAVKVIATNYRPRVGGFRDGGGAYVNNAGKDSPDTAPQGDARLTGEFGTTANRRNVWNDISPEAYHGQHYATFPPDLPRICIQASTSEAGVCAKCGSQWARVVEHNEDLAQTRRGTPEYESGGLTSGKHFSSATPGVTAETRTLSWRATCGCNAAKTPAVVLDPFAGTGTTLLAAMRLGRRSVGTDLSEDYLNMAIQRLSAQTLPLELT